MKESLRPHKKPLRRPSGSPRSSWTGPWHMGISQIYGFSCGSPKSTLRFWGLLDHCSVLSSIQSLVCPRSIVPRTRPPGSCPHRSRGSLRSFPCCKVACRRKANSRRWQRPRRSCWRSGCHRWMPKRSSQTIFSDEPDTDVRSTYSWKLRYQKESS